MKDPWIKYSEMINRLYKQGGRSTDIEAIVWAVERLQHNHIKDNSEEAQSDSFLRDRCAKCGLDLRDIIHTRVSMEEIERYFKQEKA